MLKLRKGVSLEIANLVVILLSWFQVFHYCCVYTSVKTQVTDIIRMSSCILELVHFSGVYAKYYDWLQILFWVGNPNDLHFMFFLCKS